MCFGSASRTRLRFRYKFKAYNICIYIKVINIAAEERRASARISSFAKRKEACSVDC
jgi:hypothetical protein